MALVQRGTCLAGNLNPFRAALKRLEDVGFRTLEVDAPGQDVKVTAAIKRGDTIPAKPLTAALKEALEANWGAGMSPARVRTAVENACTLALRSVLLSGQVQGPPRKTPNRTGKKLVDTGELARSMRAKAKR